MKITINKLMGVEAVTFDLNAGRVTEVIGPNASGKTSIATAVQALLTRNLNPLGLPVSEARTAYLRDGSDEGSAELSVEHEGDEFHLQWDPKAQTFTTDGWPGHSFGIPETVGLVDFTIRRSPRERAAVFHSVLLPPEEVIRERLSETLAAILNTKDLRGVLEIITEQGWEKAEAIYKDRGKAAKASWREVTGETYGVRKATDWIPDGWLAQYDGLTEIAAESNAQRSRDELYGIHKVQAASEADIEAQREAIASISDLQTAVDHAATMRDEAERRRQAFTAEIEAGAEQHRAATDRLRILTESALSGVMCPHCGEFVEIVHGPGKSTLQKFSVPDPAEHESARAGFQKEIDEHVARHQHLDGEYLKTERLANQWKAEWHDKSAALRSAKEWADRELQTAVEDNAEAIEHAEQAVRDAEGVIKMVRQKTKAEQFHRSVKMYTEVATALGPQGVRSRMLAKGISGLNAGLAVLADTTEWARTEVTEKGDVTFGGRPVTLCSESERWRSQASIQLTLSAMAGCPAVVLDRGDLLDPENRKRLEVAIRRVTDRKPIAVLLLSTGAMLSEAKKFDGVMIVGGQNVVDVIGAKETEAVA